MGQNGWLDEREQRAWRALQIMHMQIEGELARRLTAESNLSYPDYVVLVALTERADGRMRLFELGAKLRWEKSRLSHHISRMEKRGLVSKKACEEDRRGAFVAITHEGQAEIRAAAPGHVAAVRELFIDHLTEAQLDTVGDVAEAVLSALRSGDQACFSDRRPVD